LQSATSGGAQASDPDYYNQDAEEYNEDKPATSIGKQARDQEYYNQNADKYIEDQESVSYVNKKTTIGIAINEDEVSYVNEAK